jgi:hypothetical protein
MAASCDGFLRLNGQKVKLGYLKRPGIRNAILKHSCREEIDPVHSVLYKLWAHENKFYAAIRY